MFRAKVLDFRFYVNTEYLFCNAYNFLCLLFSFLTWFYMLIKVWVAAFAVSGYASTYTRAGQKPFNPLLGETYECIREDKGWKFVAEQVSVSAVCCDIPPNSIQFNLISRLSCACKGYS